MKQRETATRITIKNLITGVCAPSVYVNGKYDDCVKHVRKTNTLVSRFPEKWIAY